MLDFSAQKLQLDAFSVLASNLIDTAKIGPLESVLSMDLLENGDPGARNVWISQQIFNLLSHARVHSKFWANRLDRKALNNLASAPVLSRRELAEQVVSEGALPLGGLHQRAVPHATSGSTGVASRFFITDMNAGYSGLRSIAQYLFEGRSLELNRVSIKRAAVADKKGYTISSSPHWAGPLAQVFRNGSGRLVNFQHADYAQLGAELSKRPCGYFNTMPSQLMALVSAMGRENFLKLRIAEFVSTGQKIPQELRELCDDSGIRVRDTYSSEEIGPIAFECAARTGTFHIATSNVVVECDGPFHEIDGHRVGRLLITHLHSYATPFIRYEVGDLGALAPACPCGHRGPVISCLSGRIAAFLRHRDGAISSFQVGPRHFEKVLPVKEYRARQTALDKVVVEVIPEGQVSEHAKEAIAELLRGHFGLEFQVEVRIVDLIDWGESYKRLVFRCEI